MDNLELLNAIMPFILSAVATVLASIGAYLGLKVKDLLDTKQKKEIVEKTIQYVEQVGKVLGSAEKKALAMQKASEWIETKGLKVSEVELDILIEAFVNDFYSHSSLFAKFDEEEVKESVIEEPKVEEVVSAEDDLEITEEILDEPVGSE